MKRPHLGAAIAATSLLTIGGMSALPILATGIGAAAPPVCGPVADDETPAILGTSVLTVADLRAWWDGTRRPQPARLGVPIDDLIALYITEGQAEGVRGDLAIAQAIVETGYFTNRDTAIHNYAGIAHHDNASSGLAFSDPVIGVRAHIQLLKKYALGNTAPLARRTVAPRAGASATTWGGLAGTWASATTYWTTISAVYDDMTSHTTTTPTGLDHSEPATCPHWDLAISGDYALPVERHWYDQHPQWFTQPHHDYPAIDLPVPAGTPLFAITNGVIVATPTSGRCGIGIVLNGDDDAQYTYCHGQPGSQKASVGQRVTVGRHLLNSGTPATAPDPTSTSPSRREV